MCALRALGATDAIVQSHTQISVTHGPRDHWAAIGCVNWPSEGQYRFRLVFPSPSMAETVYVYANFRRYVAGPNRLDLVPSSMKLLPLRDLCWYNPTSTFFHPQAISAATLVDTKVRIDRLPPLTATNDILAALRGSRLPTPDVDITGDGYVTLTFDTPAPVAFLWSTSGPHGDTRLYIRDIAVHLHILTGRPRQPAAPLQCRDCGRHDHQGQPCDRFTYLDPRDRAHSKSHHKSTTRRDIHTQPRHEPAQYKSPPPRGTPHTLRLHLSLYLQRELSTTWINASYRPRAHSDGRLSPSALTKKPSLHLSPPQALISSTLDARLLEERRLREAAELLQAEDNRLRTAAHIRLNTAVTQHESHQAALAACLIYLESSVHTLLQAMQSVSSEISALAGLDPYPLTSHPTRPCHPPPTLL
ncbi:hypothetical protein DYB28_000125 [Aphanomyces astaci]|uniref:CCHC-type domain-containing protein n=1 Tax=Aphanomyces astaci TaxID=112090 RepID=A0A397BXK4_APHAT|nr:hypothetical protein DYB25_012867 [Aphanomyces astaci]RHY63047.1 hypothetical protein DYB30_009701 [Aphanomyces astaci]RHZ42282.1 hypothetical protein DYB26_003950 [Aphanomyces astaci]RLO07107.1 hypothetical protein DYB28_000125 [Aphanomyces astaci]